MSKENVGIVRRQFDHWNAGDFEALREDFHPDVVVEAPEGWPEGSVSRGFDTWVQQARRLRDTWQEARVEVDDIRPVGNDRVIAEIRYITRGKAAAMSFDTPMAVAFFFDEGKISQARYFWNAEALEAAGLSE